MGLSHMVQRGALALPNSFSVRLKYCAVPNLTTTASAGTAASYIFRLSSLFDPDLSGTGHQPYQFDQLTPVYTKYLVKGVSIRVRFRNAQGHSNMWAGVRIRPDTDATSLSGKGLEEVLELQNVFFRPLGFYDDRQSSLIYESYIDLPSLFDLSTSEYTSQRQNFGSAVTTNPTRNAYLECAILDHAAEGAKTVPFDVELIYHAEMFGYQSVSQS